MLTLKRRYSFCRHAVFKHHHRTDVISALQMRHVVALDAQRRLRKLQCVLQLGQGPTSRIVVTARRIRCRTNSSRALWVTVSSNCRRSPRCGTRSQPSNLEASQATLHRAQRHRAPSAPTPAWVPQLAAHRHTSTPSPCRQAHHRRVLQPCRAPTLAAHNPSTTHEEHLHRCLQLVIGNTMMSRSSSRSATIC